MRRVLHSASMCLAGETICRRGSIESAARTQRSFLEWEDLGEKCAPKKNIVLGRVEPCTLKRCSRVHALTASAKMRSARAHARPALLGRPKVRIRTIPLLHEVALSLFTRSVALSGLICSSSLTEAFILVHRPHTSRIVSQSYTSPLFGCLSSTTFF